MRTLLVVVTLGMLAALAGAIVRAASRTAAPRPVWIAAAGAAHARGVRRFAVLAETPRSLAVVLDAAGGAGDLGVRVAGGDVVQHLALAGRWTLRTQRDRIELGHDDAPRLVAERGAGGWLAVAPVADAADALALIVGLDGELAVQGSSLVFGDAYVACTVRCTAASACLRRSPPALAGCADDIVTCAACLERTP